MRTCPFCNYENEAFLRFCLNCGGDVDEALGPSVAEPEPPSLPTARVVYRSDTTPDLPVSDVAKTPRMRAEVDKTLDPGGAVKPGSVAAQAVAQALAVPPTTPKRATTGPPSLPAAAPPHATRLVLILENGRDGDHFTLKPQGTTFGRSDGEVCFTHDEFLAPRHAIFRAAEGGVEVTPLDSSNGVFAQVSGAVTLQPGDVFRVGQQLLQFQEFDRPQVGADGEELLGAPLPADAWGRIGQLIAPDSVAAVYVLRGQEVRIGRDRGDITFPLDGFVSGSHARLTRRDGRVELEDLKSSNGTYLRLRRPAVVPSGALVLLGQQLLRIER